MRPRLKKQNQVKYSKRSRLDKDLIILQRVIKRFPISPKMKIGDFS